jgi:signal transduction histidine kinase
MALDAPDLEGRWRHWLVERNRRGQLIGIFLVLGLYPLFGLLDRVIAPPDALAPLLAARLLVVCVTLALIPLRLTEAWARWSIPVTAGFTWMLAAGISAMTVYLGGLASPYYAGISLVLAGAPLLFVWPARVVATTHGSIVATYVGLNLLEDGLADGPASLSNVAFLTAMAVIVGVGQVHLFRSHREQHDQRVRLERATANLERAHADLTQLSEFKSRFFANMTHELRTPLSMILTPIELALQGETGPLNEAQRSSYQTMLRSALKLLKLINDLLDLSRLEESRLRLDLGHHDLVGQLRGLVEQIQVLAQRKSISLVFAPAVEQALVWCDADRLDRVFVNLLSNAIKFTPDGGHVLVQLGQAGDGVQVTVEDDGPGFPPDKAERLFERFFQVDMAGTRQHGGTGIGLALARELVLLHGGTIEAASDGRSGARFTVRLPVGAAPAGGEPARVETGGHETGLDWVAGVVARPDFRLLEVEEASERRVVDRDEDEGQRAYSVVVVEDSPQIVKLIHSTLRGDFKVLAAGDGLKGLELVRRERPHLVVTDLMMPGIDGLELTRRLRADERTRHIPILMLTARGSLDDRVKGLETGVSAYLTKPFAPRELVTAARQLVRVEEQTADLVLTQRMESIELVAAGLAHELNNPLNYVKNALLRVRQDAEQAVTLVRAAQARTLDPSELIRLDRAGQRIGEMLTVADSGLKRMGGTVELMSRYGRAGYRRDLVPHDVWEAIRTVVAVVLPAIGRPVQVELELTGNGLVECVPEEFAQVLTNLIQNAIEAAPEAGGRVTVQGSGDDQGVELVVRDNGAGIPADLQPRLFTPFLTTKGPGRGVGLGLTIVRRVVQSLGGTIQAGNWPGGGAEFKVRVPRRQRRPEPPAPPARAG